MRNARLDEAQAEIKIAGRKISHLRYADDNHSYGRKQRGTEEPLNKGEGGDWKSWLKTQHSKNEDNDIQSHHFMHILGETMGTVADFILGGSIITADGNCHHESKRHLLLGRKAMTNLNNILESQDITWPTVVCIVKAMVFPLGIYGYKSCTIKKAKGRRINAFKLWCWRRLLRIPWTARR